MPRTVITRSPKHTPLCDSKCEIKHNDLVLSLYESNLGPPISKENRIGISCGHLNLKQCIESCVNRGWDRDSFVEDTSEVLQKPLVYLAACFGKGKSLDLLLKMGLSPSSRTKEGETALHGAVRYLYKCCGLCSSRVRKQYFLTLFAELNRSDPKLVLQKDQAQQQTALHAAAEMLTKDKLDHLCKLTYKSKRKRHLCKRSYRSKQQRDYYNMCMETMLNSMVESMQKGFISYEEVMETIESKDHEGNTVMNILERSPHEEGSAIYRYILDTFLNSNKEKMMELTVSMPNLQKTVQGDLSQVQQPDSNQSISASDESELETCVEDGHSPPVGATKHEVDDKRKVLENQSMVVHVDPSAVLINYPEPPGATKKQVPILNGQTATIGTSTVTTQTVSVQSTLFSSPQPRALLSSKRKRSNEVSVVEVKGHTTGAIVKSLSHSKAKMSRPNSVDVGAQAILNQNSTPILPRVGVPRYATAIPVRVNEFPAQTSHSSHVPINYLALKANTHVSPHFKPATVSSCQEAPSSTRKGFAGGEAVEPQNASSQPMIVCVDSLTSNGSLDNPVPRPKSSVKDEVFMSASAKQKVSRNCETVKEHADQGNNMPPSSATSPEQPTSTQSDARLPLENSVLDLVVMEDSGLDAAGKSDVLNVFQLHYRRRLADIKSITPSLDAELNQKRADLQTKQDKLDELECQMAFLKNQIGSLSAEVQEKEQKRKALVEEEGKLLKRITLCDETKKKIGDSER